MSRSLIIRNTAGEIVERIDITNCTWCNGNTVCTAHHNEAETARAKYRPQPPTPAEPEEEVEEEGDTSYLEDLLELARETHCHGSNNTIEIDDDAEISAGNDGTWVQAWVFLSNEQLRDAGIPNEYDDGPDEEDEEDDDDG